MNIDISKITANLKDTAKAAVKQMKDNPAQGSIFDAANKLGINNMGDLKAGIELFKEDPKATAKEAFTTLAEKGFFGEDTQNKVKEFSIDNIGSNFGTNTTKATENKTETTETKQTETTQKEEAKPSQEEVKAAVDEAVDEAVAEAEAEETTTATNQDNKGEKIIETKDKEEFGGLLGKLGIKNTDDLSKGLKNFFDNPQETTESAAEKLGINEDTAKKLSSFVAKFAK